MKRTIRATILAGMAIAVTPVVGQVVTPSGLVPGDEYRLVFITVGTVNPWATGTDISAYNAFAQSDAVANVSLAALGTTWTTIGSTSSVSAQDNTSSVPGTDGAGIPIYNVNDERIADNYAELWSGMLAEPVVYDRDGVGGLVAVATGSMTGGTPSAGFALGDIQVMVGNSASSSGTWVDTTYFSGDASRQLYTISDVLTYVPEPRHYTVIAALGLIAFGTWRRSRKRD